MSSAHCMPTLIWASNKTEPDITSGQIYMATCNITDTLTWLCFLVKPEVSSSPSLVFLVLLWMLHKFSEHVAALPRSPSWGPGSFSPLNTCGTYIPGWHPSNDCYLLWAWLFHGFSLPIDDRDTLSLSLSLPLSLSIYIYTHTHKLEDNYFTT